MTQFRCSRSQLITEKDTLPGVSLIHYKYGSGFPASSAEICRCCCKLASVSSRHKIDPHRAAQRDSRKPKPPSKLFHCEETSQLVFTNRRGRAAHVTAQIAAALLIYRIYTAANHMRQLQPWPADNGS